MRGMRTAVSTILIAALAIVISSRPLLRAAAPPRSVLILFDSASEWGVLGAEYALMLENLLGHFPANVTKKTVTTYVAGDIGRHDATFYIGAIYDEPLFYPPGSRERLSFATFVRDAANPPRPLVWINHNIWHLAWNWNPAWGEPTFAARFGLDYWGIDDWSKLNRVIYKNTELLKGVVPYVIPVGVQQAAPERGKRAIRRHGGFQLLPAAQLPPPCIAEGNGAYACQPALSVMGIVDARKARMHAEAFSTFANARYPYITQSGNFWYVGDLPFAFISEEDRYLAFADLLHDMIGIAHAESHNALVRLEDVSAGDDTQDVRQAINALAARRIPFGVAAIPLYLDPAGVYSGGSSQALAMSGSSIADVLRRAVRRQGAAIIQHGTTHQFETLENPYTAASGDDAEFYRVIEHPDFTLTYAGPVPDDSAEWARTRTLEGKTELTRAGLTAFAWEAPHYAASPTDYAAVRGIYGTQVGRVMYAAPGSPPGRFIWQFFPYVIHRDAYGFGVIPESLGYVDPDPLPGYPVILPDALIRAAAAQRVVRDGVAGFFYHPFLGSRYLVDTVDGIRRLGYRFVMPADP